jgi:hypothetical protein
MTTLLHLTGDPNDVSICSALISNNRIGDMIGFLLAKIVR